MVLWEITLGTAYFLGLKRTYRLALKIQRRLVSPKYPSVRQFLQSKTRTIFDTTLKVHREIQLRDLEVGRNLGNWILRWLDRMKPAAQIRPNKPTQYNSNKIRTSSKQLTDSRHQKFSDGFPYRESSRRLVTSSRNLWLTTFPTVAKLLRRQGPFMSNTQYRQFISRSNNLETGFGFNGVIRNDIMQWMAHG